MSSARSQDRTAPSRTEWHICPIDGCDGKITTRNSTAPCPSCGTGFGERYQQSPDGLVTHSESLDRETARQYGHNFLKQLPIVDGTPRVWIAVSSHTRTIHADATCRLLLQTDEIRRDSIDNHPSAWCKPCSNCLTKLDK